MPGRSDPRQRAVVTLLRNVRSRHALARDSFVRNAVGRSGDQTPQQRSEFEARLPGIVEGLIEELSSESDLQRRRFEVLRRTDIAHENHRTVARDVGLSRSQFYRDLQEARERFTDALQERLAPAAGSRSLGRGDTRFIAIETLRETGRHDRACALANVLARSTDVADAVRALCLRSELETESGSFGDAHATADEARALLPGVADDRLRRRLDAECDIVDFEAAHCQGVPVHADRRANLIDRLRRDYRPGDGECAALLVKATIEEASVLFERGGSSAALATIEEACSMISKERLENTRLGVDVKIRASGIRALAPEHVAAALEESAGVVETGRRSGDVRTLRVGMQMMAAHLLTLGRFDEARHYALESLSLIELFGSPLDRVIVLSNLARIDIHQREGLAALKWIGMAKASPCDAFSITQALAISESEALVLVDQAVRAAGMSQALSARVSDWPRLYGRAKLAETIALSALGRERDARACSDEAVELSRGTAGPLLHLRALDLNVKLTGSARSRAALHDLRAALHASTA